MQKDTRSAARRGATLGALTAAIGLWAVGIGPRVAVAGGEQAAAASAAPRLGEFTMTGYMDISTIYKASAIIADLGGRHLRLASPRYDMAAPHIHAEAGKGGQPPRFKMTDMVATGGVTIVTRDEAANQTTTVTCDKAVYHATTDPKDRGRIDLTGHVRSVRRDPTLTQPLVVTAETGTITFPDGESTQVVLHAGEPEGGSITGAIREPAPKKKK